MDREAKKADHGQNLNKAKPESTYESIINTSL
jgi:hypothetical protein